MSDSVLPEIVNDPELIVESDEEAMPEELQIEMKVRDIDPDEVFEKKRKDKTTAPVVPLVKPVKKEPKPKRQMSEAHKAKLAQAREKALETRRRNAEEKKKIKELESKVNAKQKQKKIKEMENIVNDIPEQVTPVKAEIDDSIIQKAIEEALTKQEMMRQERKRLKKQKQEEEIKKAKAQEAIRQAVYPPKLYAGDQGFASKHIFNFQ
jgi:hypothetical protein